MGDSTTDAATGQAAPHPGLTLRVYTVDAATGARTSGRPKTAVTPGPTDPPLAISIWPPCRCDRCRPEDHR
ncbi:hypothetical protein [Actinacidiphila sp. ITFR-21]|uniref:hypothetical protein n=1 Tax=Actinacidiphila sp. ITFR-21 TaxID=3075199 RepID=UPI002889D05A|nr:hypothetical protein [Streptomyces sp. ITFR-21]WNI19244.1 hypothetical protein RLT57_29315 [Streptomyces sp. ITFR-21]